MAHLEDVSGERLREALAAVDGSKPTQRLTAAIAYKNGVPQSELAEWFGVRRRTIYDWLTRLEEEPLERAAVDESRSGRRRKLGDAQRARLEDALRDSPTAAGYDAPAWTPSLVQQYLTDAFDAAYSRPSCRRLMAEAGLRYVRPQRAAAESRASDSPASLDDGEKRRGRWVPGDSVSTGGNDHR